MIRWIYQKLFGPSIQSQNAIYTLREAFVIFHESSIRLAFIQCKKAKVIPDSMSYQEFHELMEDL